MPSSNTIAIDNVSYDIKFHFVQFVNSSFFLFLKTPSDFSIFLYLGFFFFISNIALTTFQPLVTKIMKLQERLLILC